MRAIVQKFVRQPLVAPMKRGLVLACLLLLTACGSVVNPTAEPTTAPATTSPTLVVATPASPTPEPAPQLDFAAGMTAVQQQQAQTFFDNHLLAAGELPAAVHLLTAVAADGRTILYTDPPGRDDLARAYGLDGEGNPTPTIILESPYTPGEPLWASVAGAREVNTAVTQVAVNEQGVIVGLDDSCAAVAFVAPQAGPDGQLVAPWTVLETQQIGVVVNLNGLHLSLITDQHGRMLHLISPHHPEGVEIIPHPGGVQIADNFYRWDAQVVTFVHTPDLIAPPAGNFLLKADGVYRTEGGVEQLVLPLESIEGLSWGNDQGTTLVDTETGQLRFTYNPDSKDWQAAEIAPEQLSAQILNLPQMYPSEVGGIALENGLSAESMLIKVHTVTDASGETYSLYAHPTYPEQMVLMARNNETGQDYYAFYGGGEYTVNGQTYSGPQTLLLLDPEIPQKTNRDQVTRFNLLLTS